MGTIISVIFVASLFFDIWLLFLAIIGVFLACIAHADERRK